MDTLLKRTALVLALALMIVPALGAQESGSLRFEKTIDYKLDQLIPLNATVGPVRVTNIRISRGSSGGGGGVLGRIRPGAASETEATLSASFDTENPKEDEWVVTYTLDFFDAKGKLIDRASKSKGFEGEAGVFTLDHPILEYVLPMIDRVKVRLEARFD
ncbi:MAG TPA: hypothetical protein VEG34_00750 [Thermoanaerobaculia bacterium]|nr:hypothetical protein [Thermoanaerobaculia bacterium]